MRKPVPHIAIRKIKNKYRYVVLDPPGLRRPRLIDFIAADRVVQAKGNVRTAHETMHRDFPGWKPISGGSF